MFVAFDIPVSSLTPRSLSVADNRESLTTIGLGSEVPPAISALRNPAKTLPAGPHTRHSTRQTMETTHAGQQRSDPTTSSPHPPAAVAAPGSPRALNSMDDGSGSYGAPPPAFQASIPALLETKFALQCSPSPPCCRMLPLPSPRRTASTLRFPSQCCRFPTLLCCRR